MDFQNKEEERRDWRAERRQWRDQRRRMREERAKHYGERWMAHDHSGKGNVWTGLFLLVIGSVALLKAMNMIPAEYNWLWSWGMFLVALGFFLGLKHAFRGGAWFILIIIGGVLIIHDINPGVNSWAFLWPGALILLGLFIIFRPRRHRYWKEYVDDKVDEAMNAKKDAFTSSEDFIDSTSIFGGVKKNVISKNFKGGDITNIMGGSEIDLTQADINGTVAIDLTQVFGGTKLIVPSNWQVKAQMAAIFGGVEDKRSAQNAILDPNKILILDGTSIFGGIEIKSY